MYAQATRPALGTSPGIHSESASTRTGPPGGLLGIEASLASATRLGHRFENLGVQPIQRVKYIRKRSGQIVAVEDDYKKKKNERWAEAPEESSADSSHDEPVEREPPPPDPYNISFEASGDVSHPLAYARKLEESGTDYRMQVGLYEKEGEEMGGARDNIAALQELDRGRGRIRVNKGRDATRENSPTRYDAIVVRNLMAAREGGQSDTSKESNEPLTQGVFGAQSGKLKAGGQLHFGGSGRPYFKPGDHRMYDDRVDVDRIARGANLTRDQGSEYADDFKVKKNKGKRRVGVDGTYTRVYKTRGESRPLPVPMPEVRE